jgi:hypothetical protein
MNGPSYRMKETKEWLKEHREVVDFSVEEDVKDKNIDYGEFKDRK